MGGGLDETLFGDFPNFERFRAYTSGILQFNRKTMELRPLREGSQVVAGTLLGRVGDEGAGLAPHLNFSIRPAGRGAPTIDPKPILDGWKLLEATALYRVADKDPFATDASSISEILLLSKEQLARRVLADRDLEIYECGRQDIATGQIDRRLLAMLEYLVGRGYTLTITSLKCGHSTLTTSGNVSEHTIGSAVDIAAINGVPVIGHQGPGTLAESLIRDLLQLQGTMVPHQIISLMDYFGADNTFAMSRPRRPRPRRLRAGLRLGRGRGQRGELGPARPGARAGAVGAADRPALRDRQPAGLGQAVRVRDPRAQGRQAGLAGARGRVAPPAPPAPRLKK